jgi:hypothetical protein
MMMIKKIFKIQIIWFWPLKSNHIFRGLSVQVTANLENTLVVVERSCHLSPLFLFKQFFLRSLLSSAAFVASCIYNLVLLYQYVEVKVYIQCLVGKSWQYHDHVGSVNTDQKVCVFGETI